MSELDQVEVVDVDQWCREALTAATIAERNRELFNSFLISLGELAVRQDLGVELDVPSA